MITYATFERICREEGLAERFIQKIWDARAGIMASSGRDPAEVSSEQGFREALRFLIGRWPHVLKEPS